MVEASPADRPEIETAEVPLTDQRETEIVEVPRRRRPQSARQKVHEV
jgi:hypothetical protein